MSIHTQLNTSAYKEYREAVAYIESFSYKSIRSSNASVKDKSIFLARTRHFLDLLGDPGKNIRYVHITGTAGKGTVSKMIQGALTASGKKTGLFTSPYVTTTIEKIAINGRYIAPDEFVELVEYIKPFIVIAKDGPYGELSAFELMVVLALLYFQRQGCEWAVLEVGFGGRYDATNVIKNPVATAITNIDYDHTEILGKTLRKIATDKAGIIKPGCGFFTSEQRPALRKIFRGICSDMHASYHPISRQQSAARYNIELVTAICSFLGISDAHIEKGIADARLPCRFEIIERKPLVILDGAHNRAKIRSTIAQLTALRFKKLYIVTAIADNKKDNRLIVNHLANLSYPTEIMLTQVVSGERKTLSPRALVETLQKHSRVKKTGGKRKVSIAIIEDAGKALDQALKKASSGDCVLVTGSFFLAGELRKRWYPEEYVLENRNSGI